MNKEQKIKAIYDKIANKELTFGCKAKIEDYNWTEYNVIIVNLKEWYYKIWDELRFINEFELETEKIIGHLIMIWDVLDYLNIETVNNLIDFNYEDITEEWKIINLWKYKRKPIEEQDDEVIDYIYNLTK